MKRKSKLAGLSAVLTIMLFFAASLSAQSLPTPFEIANEVMTYEQSSALNFIEVTLGPDPASVLTFTNNVDPAGQSFNLSLSPGSTYLGQPITLSISGSLSPFQVWNVSTSGEADGVPWNGQTVYVPPSALGYRGTGLPCDLNCAGFLDYQSWIRFLNLPPWQHTVTICSSQAETPPPGSFGVIDQKDCDDFLEPSGMEVTGAHKTTYSYGFGNGSNNWYWNAWDQASQIQAAGSSPTDGSPGSGTATISALTVSTTSVFSDLGSGANTYQCCAGFPVSGSGAGTSHTAANLFTAQTNGTVSKIDVGIGYVSGTDSFYAAIYTNSGGLPGTQIGRWDNLSAKTTSGQCCGVVSINGVSGLNLTAGQQYFMVLGPEDNGSDASLTWNANTQNVTGLSLDSNDGGQTWNSNGQQTLGAFDIVMQAPITSTEANQFIAAASGGVSQIDVAVGYVNGVNSFYAAVYTSNDNLPGAQLARWDNLSSSQNNGGCCGLVSITGIAGLSLSAGQAYFLVLGPESSNTSEMWNLNSLGAIGLELFSADGGLTWNSRGQQPQTAFDVLGKSTFFSNLGSGSNVYQRYFGRLVSGADAGGPHSPSTSKTAR